MNAPTESNNILYLARLKGTVSPDQICLKVVWFIRPRLGHVTLDIKKKYFTLPLILYWLLKFLCDPH